MFLLNFMAGFAKKVGGGFWQFQLVSGGFGSFHLLVCTTTGGKFTH